MKKRLRNCESPKVSRQKGVIDGALGILGTWSANVLAPTKSQTMKVLRCMSVLAILAIYCYSAGNLDA
mgnify:CR=1 FL=1